MKVGSYKIKTKTLIVAGIIVSVGFIMTSVIKSGLQDRYAQDMINYRKEKNDYFKTSADSPIEDQVGFQELRYFEPDKNYRVQTTLYPIRDSSFIKLANNDGEKNKYWRYALAVFNVNDKIDTLTIFRKASLKKEDNSYFIPFYDETNGDETYTGGRYLDLEIRDTTALIIDFNRAYSPYCVYNYRFSCPVPPIENKLEMRIEAGEKIFLK